MSYFERSQATSSISLDKIRTYEHEKVCGSDIMIQRQESNWPDETVFEKRGKPQKGNLLLIEGLKVVVTNCVQ